MKLRFYARARADLLATIEYIAERSPKAAEELGGRVLAIIERLADGDFEGPEEHLRSGKLVRSWPIPPVRIYYQRRDDSLVVLRIYHHARRPITSR